MNQKINFIKSQTEDNCNRYVPKDGTTDFYQICTYTNPKTGKYSVKVVTFNGEYDIVAINYKKYSKDRCKQLIKSLPETSYRLYPAQDARHIGDPTSDDLIKVTSELLGNMSYSGYAIF